jgi:hypothetical protein
MSFMLGNTAVENVRALAQSALPNAPQVPDPEPAPRRATALRARLSTALRATARQELKLADRLDPAPRCEPFPG